MKEPLYFEIFEKFVQFWHFKKHYTSTTSLWDWYLNLKFFPSVDSFEPLSVGPHVKLNTLINLQENIVLIQKGEVSLSVKTNTFEVARIIQDGGVIYSKLCVIKYLINRWVVWDFFPQEGTCEVPVPKCSNVYILKKNEK